jgi:hypothetical protein
MIYAICVCFTDNKTQGEDKQKTLQKKQTKNKIKTHQKNLNKQTKHSTTQHKPTSFDKDEILANHRSFMTSLNIPSGKESEDLPYLYWIPKLHKTPYNERWYIELKNQKF